MAQHSTSTQNEIIPEACYRDAPGGMAFLERAFGFRPSLIVPGARAESVAHAELWIGKDCFMLSSAAESGPWRYRVPREIGGVNTGSAYLATSDIEGLYARAVAAGATIASDLADTDYGSRDFSARDPEGFLWHFGTYRPRAGETGGSADASLEPELFSGMRYVDARAAIAWLSRAFGATEQLVVPGEGTDIAHAQLLLGQSVFMLGSARDDHFNLQTPNQIGGDYTQTLNVWVADPDAQHARAAAAGAEIVGLLADTPYGARGYVARDCEGYVWRFSTYRPAPPQARLDAAPISG
jgi:uncharacterized glyoxalase superfamily protein PhnB